MERALYINKFRNIGLESSERLVLNHSLEKGKMGDLVILVGPNNSGKSNVLDALNVFAAKKITSRDKTNLSYEPEMQKPNLSLVCKDEESEYRYTLDHNNKITVSYPNMDKDEPVYDFMNNKSTLYNELTNLYQIFRNYGCNFNELIGVINNFDGENLETRIINAMNTINTTYAQNVHYKNAWFNYKSNYPKSSLVKNFGSEFNKEKRLFETYKNKYKVDFLPKIIVYKETIIKNSDIKCNAQDVTNNPFLCKVFKLINISLDEVTASYKASNEQGSRNPLTTLERKVNKKLIKLAKDFNDLYFAEDDKYEFKMTFESEKIFFELNRGNSGISLDYQSTGFKWFFNLYFNLLSETTLNPGDIIVMDEPATNLHIKGMMELRVFLKDFAVKNDLAIVLATHLPFLIDVNYLDELRVIVNRENISTISNDFTAIDIDDPDTLKPVKHALTVSNHMLFDPDRKVIFVEGITDYNYMLAFKKILGIEDDIVFLPIQGVENIKEAGYKERQKERSKRLIEIRKHNPILMVDGDNAGKSMKQVNKEDSELTVFSLADVDPKFIMIEHLFSSEDIEMLKLIKSGNNRFEKSSSKSSLLKTHYDQYSFTEETKKNFQTVFDYIAEHTN